MRCQRFGLAGIQTFGFEEFIETGINAVGNLVQDGHAFRDRHIAPRPLERGVGGGDSLINFGLARFVDNAKLLIGCRIDVGESLAGCRTDKLAIDEMLDLFHCQTSKY